MRLATPLGLVLALLISHSSLAQPLFATADSLEAAVSNADLVIVARITRLSDIEPPPDEPGHWVNLEIDETLKMSLQEGPHERLGMFLKRDLEELEHWIDESAPLLIAYDNTQPYQAQVITLEPDKVEVMNRDFEVLRDAEEVIRVARTTIRRTPRNVTRVATFRLFVPRERCLGTQWAWCLDTGGRMLLHVPADVHLEKKAIKMVESNDTFDRTIGISALFYFESEENRERMLSLLKDPGHYDDDPELGPDGFMRFRRRYVIRAQAYSVLRCWGLEVEQPVIEEFLKVE